MLIEKQLTATKNVSSIDLLADNVELSRADLKRAMQAGAVWLDRGGRVRRLRRAKLALIAGDIVRIHYNSDVINPTADAQAAHAELVADESDYSLWFKPSGMFTQGTKWGDANSIERVAELQLERATRIVHRLDRHTSGIMLLAHNKRAAAALSLLFSDRSIKKTYHAVSLGEFDGGELVVDTALDEKPSRSTVSLLQTTGEQSLLNVVIESGRKHQVRRHLASIGYPIVGDRLHGDESADSTRALQLCAAELEFTCPLTGELRHFRSPHMLSL